MSLKNNPVLAELAHKMREDDIRRANNLRRTAHLSKRAPGTGPRIAR